MIVDHLDRMSAQLQETQSTVDSLRRMLVEEAAAFPVAYRDEPTLTALAVVDRVAGSDVVAWWMDAFHELHRTVRVGGATRIGTDGALFPTEFFADEVGDLVAFVPVDRRSGRSAGARHGVPGPGGPPRRHHVRRPTPRPRPGVRCGRPVGLRPGRVLARPGA